MKRVLFAIAIAFALGGACADDEPAKPKAKAKKAEHARKPGEPKQKLWISPSDKQRLENERAQAKAKKKASASK